MTTYHPILVAVIIGGLASSLATNASATPAPSTADEHTASAEIADERIPANATDDEGDPQAPHDAVPAADAHEATSTPAAGPVACGTTPGGHNRLHRFRAHEETYGAESVAKPRRLRVGLPTEDAARSLSFGWTTGERTLASQVELRNEAGEVTTIDGQSFTWGGLEDDRHERMHEVHVCGLTPSTSWQYRVGGPDHWSEWHTIKTLPPAGSDEPWRAVVFGDSRSSMRILGTLAEQVRAIDPDIIFFPGDIVGDGRVENFWRAWFDAARPMLEETIFVPGLGNHEYGSVNYFGHFSMPGDERNFMLPIGRTHWILWDDDGPYSRVVSTVVPRAKALFNRVPADVERLMMVHHQPLYSAAGHGSDRNLRDLLLDDIERIVPDAVFNAHCHNYERSCRIADDACVDADTPGTRYIVAAGAGANLVPSGREWFTEFSQSSYHFIELEIQGTSIHARVHHIDGSTIEEWTFEAPFSRDALHQDAPAP